LGAAAGAPTTIKTNKDTRCKPKTTQADTLQVPSAIITMSTIATNFTPRP